MKHCLNIYCSLIKQKFLSETLHQCEIQRSSKDNKLYLVNMKTHTQENDPTINGKNRSLNAKNHNNIFYPHFI